MDAGRQALPETREQEEDETRLGSVSGHQVIDWYSRTWWRGTEVHTHLTHMLLSWRDECTNNQTPTENNIKEITARLNEVFSRTPCASHARVMRPVYWAVGAAGRADEAPR